MIEVFKQMIKALENSVDLVIEDAYNAEQLYANVPTKQARVGGLKLLADEHQKALQAGLKAIAELESQEPDVVMHWHSHTWTTINPPPKNSGDVNLYYAPPQRTEQEPVAYINVEMRRLEFAHDYVKWDTPTTVKLDKIPLYTHPPQRKWVGLTDEELEKYHDLRWWSARELAREVESKLKERNT